MNNMNLKKVLIVGLGLIGGSYSLKLKEKGYEVGAITLNQEDIDYALEHKMIDHGQVKVTPEYINKFDFVIFCLYPSIFLEWIKKYCSYLKKGSIITDVTGVKKGIVREIQEILKEYDVEFISSHPMAGREVYGIKNAKKDLFNNANYLITPTEINTDGAIELVKKLAGDLEFKNISILSIEEHDEMIGFLSQLTHCIAISLMTCKDSEHLTKYTGDSFRDLTRIAKINENMWSELFMLNKEELISQMELFERNFIALKEAIIKDDEKKMKDMMKMSTLRRSRFDD